MRTINRYISKEVIVPFFLSLFVFTFVLLLERIMKLVELVVSKGVDLIDICLLFLYILPSFLTLTIPMSFLLGILMAFGRLSSDSEYVAMEASGISLYRMIKPVIFLSLLAYAATLYLMIYALPWGNQSFREKVFHIASSKVSSGIKERVFNDDFEGIILYADKITGEGEALERILIFDQREKNGYTIFAEEGNIYSDPSSLTVTMRLRNGEIHKPGKNSVYQRIGFSSYDLKLGFKGEATEGKGKISKGDREMTLTELNETVRKLKESGGDPRPFQVEMHKRFSIPFACIVFAAIGTPLGIQPRRSGRAFGFAISLFIFLLYYVSLTGGETLADKGIIPPLIAMWGPNILFLILGSYLVYSVGRFRQVRLLAFADGLFYAMEIFSKRIYGKDK